MGNVIADITMSLVGFITGPDDRPGRGLGERGECLHNWVIGGPWRYDDEGRRFAPAEVDCKVLDQATGSIGAEIIGRRMFDVTGGWGGNPPDGPHTRYFVLTHTVPPEWAIRRSPFTFVIDGIRGAAPRPRTGRPAADRSRDRGPHGLRRRAGGHRHTGRAAPQRQALPASAGRQPGPTPAGARTAPG
jgi:hypothetical protein